MGLALDPRLGIGQGRDGGRQRVGTGDMEVVIFGNLGALRTTPRHNKLDQYNHHPQRLQKVQARRRQADLRKGT